MVVDEMSDAAVDRLFHALADATRRDIVRRVLVAEHSVSELARDYPISVTAVQKHVLVLEEAGLVTKRRHGREQRVAGQPAALQRAQRLLDAYEQLWRDRLDRMNDVLAQDPTRRHPMSVTSIDKNTEQLTMTVGGVRRARRARLAAVGRPAPARALVGTAHLPRHRRRPRPHRRRARELLHDRAGGEQPHGYWTVLEVDPPRLLVVEDGFADDNGAPNPEMPTGVLRVEITDRPGGVTMTIASRFPSLEAMEQMLEMGMEEGLREAMGQIDDVLGVVRPTA